MGLREKQIWQETNEKTQRFAELLNRYDNYEIKWETNQDSFKTNLEKVPEFAEQVSEAITALSIESQLNRDAIAEQIKTIHFSYGKPSFKLDGTTFVVTSDLGETVEPLPFREQTKEWLLDNLG